MWKKGCSRTWEHQKFAVFGQPISHFNTLPLVGASGNKSDDRRYEFQYAPVRGSIVANVCSDSQLQFQYALTCGNIQLGCVRWEWCKFQYAPVRWSILGGMIVCCSNLHFNTLPLMGASSSPLTDQIGLSFNTLPYVGATRATRWAWCWIVFQYSPARGSILQAVSIRLCIVSIRSRSWEHL